MNFDRILRQPSSRRRSFDDQRRFFRYMRYSTHTLTLYPLVAMVFFASQLYETQASRDGIAAESAWTHPWYIVAVVLMVVTAAIMTWAIEMAPELNYEPRTGFITALGITACASVVTSIFGFTATALLEPLGDAYSMFYAGFFGLCGLAWTVIPFLKRRWILLAVDVVLVTLASQWAHFDQTVVLIIFPVAMFLGMIMTMWILDVMKELEHAKNAEAALGVSEERLRIAQQLHDSTGQSLAAVSLKVQLLDKLLQRDEVSNPAIHSELEQLKELVGSTSTHMREVVHGYRKVTIEHELAGAAALLKEAGLTVTILGEAKDLHSMPTSAQQTAAWFIREVSTNVLKHSTATWAEVRLASDHIKIKNDGAMNGALDGAMKKPSSLSGLASLSAQAQKDGGTILAERSGEEFTTTLSFQAATAGSATANTVGNTITGTS